MVNSFNWMLEAVSVDQKVSEDERFPFGPCSRRRFGYWDTLNLRVDCEAVTTKESLVDGTVVFEVAQKDGSEVESALIDNFQTVVIFPTEVGILYSSVHEVAVPGSYWLWCPVMPSFDGAVVFVEAMP